MTLISSLLFLRKIWLSLCECIVFICLLAAVNNLNLLVTFFVLEIKLDIYCLKQEWLVLLLIVLSTCFYSLNLSLRQRY
jgi:hypothetical protein